MHASTKRQLSRGDDVKFVSLQHIPLASAYLCPNCSSIGNSSKQCPACASPFLLSLALFALSYLGLGISLYPYVVPESITFM